MSHSDKGYRTYCEGAAVVVDRIEDRGTCGKVESGTGKVGLVDCDEVVRTPVGDCIGCKTCAGRLASVQGGHRERGGRGEDEGGQCGEHRIKVQTDTKGLDGGRGRKWGMCGGVVPRDEGSR